MVLVVYSGGGGCRCVVMVKVLLVGLVVVKVVDV